MPSRMIFMFLCSCSSSLENTCSCAGPPCYCLLVTLSPSPGGPAACTAPCFCAFKSLVGWGQWRRHRERREGREGTGVKIPFTCAYKGTSDWLWPQVKGQLHRKTWTTELHMIWLCLYYGPSLLPLSIWTSWEPPGTLVFPSTHPPSLFTVLLLGLP